MTDTPITAEWKALNNTLRTCDLETAEKLLVAEEDGKARFSYLKRIANRVNRLRTEALHARVKKIAKERGTEAAKAERQEAEQRRARALVVRRSALADANYLREKLRLEKLVKKHKRKVRRAQA